MRQAWKGRATAMRIRNEVQMPTSLSVGYQNGTWNSITGSIRLDSPGGFGTGGQDASIGASTKPSRIRDSLTCPGVKRALRLSWPRHGASTESRDGNTASPSHVVGGKARRKELPRTPETRKSQ